MCVSVSELYLGLFGVMMCPFIWGACIYLLIAVEITGVTSYMDRTTWFADE